MKLKSSGTQSGSVKQKEMGSSSKSKDDGLEGGLNKKDGSKNASGKAFAGGGKVEKDEDEKGKDDDEDDEEDAADDEDSRADDGGPFSIPERKHGGSAHHKDDGLYDDHHSDDEYAKGGKVGFNPGGEKGKLHREMGISETKKIPAKRLAKAEHSRDPEIARDAKRAETMKHWKH
jgi:hypothetical protein